MDNMGADKLVGCHGNSKVLSVSVVTGRMHLCPLGEGILATPEYEI